MQAIANIQPSDAKMFKITWLVMIPRRLHIIYKYHLVSMSSHETSPKNSPSSPPPKKRKTRSTFNPSLWGYFIPFQLLFSFGFLHSPYQWEKKTHHRNQGTKWVWVKKSWQKKRKCLKLYGSMNFPKLSPQVLKKTSAPVALSLDFPLSLHLVSPVFPGQTSWPLVDV